MKINETTFRRILQEESKRVLSESIMLVEDDGPFEPGDQVTMQRRGPKRDGSRSVVKSAGSVVQTARPLKTSTSTMLPSAPPAEKWVLALSRWFLGLL